MQDGSVEEAFAQRANRFRRLLLVVLVATAVGAVALQYLMLLVLLGRQSGLPAILVPGEGQSWLNFATQGISSVAVIVAILRAVQMLGPMAASEPFSSQTSKVLRSFALWLFVATASSIAIPLLVHGVAIAVGVAISGTVEVGGSDLLLLLVSAILLQLSRLLDAAAEMADDHRQIV
jgi:hypothetical protein